MPIYERARFFVKDTGPGGVTTYRYLCHGHALRAARAAISEHRALTLNPYPDGTAPPRSVGRYREECEHPEHKWVGRVIGCGLRVDDVREPRQTGRRRQR